MRFELAVTNYPICMAARSVLLSGQYARRCTGGVGNVAYSSRPGDFNMPEYPESGRPHLRETTLPEVLRELRYDNAAIGKWHIHSWPHDVGFDDYLIPRVHHCHTGQSFTANGGPEFVPEGFSVDFEAERMEAFLQGRAASGQPFFLYYNISPPHCPTADAPERYRTMYAPTEVPIRPNVDLGRPLVNQDYWFKVYRYDFRYYNLHLPYTECLPEGYGLPHLIAEYYGLTSWVDDVLGRMLRVLDATGLAHNTIVVFTSDHGDNLGSHGLVQKGTPNEESLRIPLLVRWPALAGSAGRTITRQVAGLVDVMPTLLELVGGRAPEHVHGRSLAPLVRGEGEALEEDYAFFETGGGTGIRTPTHTYYLEWSGEEHSLQEAPRFVWHTAQDPYQLHNLAGLAQRDDLAQHLDRLLRQWHAQTPWMGSPS
jgi:choline-sulfatase